MINQETINQKNIQNLVIDDEYKKSFINKLSETKYKPNFSNIDKLKLEKLDVDSDSPIFKLHNDVFECEIIHNIESDELEICQFQMKNDDSSYFEFEDDDIFLVYETHYGSIETEILKIGESDFGILVTYRETYKELLSVFNQIFKHDFTLKLGEIIKLIDELD